jgi:hypothetical protein
MQLPNFLTIHECRSNSPTSTNPVASARFLKLRPLPLNILQGWPAPTTIQTRMQKILMKKSIKFFIVWLLWVSLYQAHQYSKLLRWQKDNIGVLSETDVSSNIISLLINLYELLRAYIMCHNILKKSKKEGDPEIWGEIRCTMKKLERRHNIILDNTGKSEVKLVMCLLSFILCWSD